MLDQIIRFALQNRLLMLAFALGLLIAGTYTAGQLPVDVLPDLDRPRVTVFLEAPGMAPEEVEALVTLPVETALNGATGVSAVRSNSAIGLGMVFVEFDYGTDIFTARQIVSEKLQTTGEQLPQGVTPVLGPISSVMGQIMLVGLSGGKETNAADLRTLANYTVRQRLLSIPGVAQVIPIGGDNLQYQVLLDMPRLNASSLTVNQVEEALRQSNLNTTGNFFDRNGSEVLIRNLGRLRSVKDIENIIVGYRDQSPVRVADVANVEFGARFKRGDGSVNGKPAVILSIEKQPGAATVGLTQAVEKALVELKPSLT
jgi:HME family heavy-metal exporter